MRRLLAPFPLALAGILMGGLILRLIALDHGLPSVFNPDEELHFVPRAVRMVGGSLDPGYYENPPALTYLLYLVFKLRFTAGFPFGGDLSLRGNPEAIFLTARLVVALLGTFAAGLAYWAGSRFYDRRVGLVAAALIAFAFIPVFYSKQALNDAVTLVPLTAGLVGCLAAWRSGRRRDWVLAGAALGVATATKYTAGAMFVPLLLAAVLRVRDGETSARDAAVGVVVAGAAFTGAFMVLNPFFFIELREAVSQVRGQSAQASGAKLGQADVPAFLYYLWTLTWGFGVLPLAAAVAGAVLALRADWRKGLLLVLFPALLLVFLSFQARYFGRWFLPAYPALAILAGYAAVRAADAVAERRPALRRFVLPALAALLVVQGVTASLRVDSVLARPDTRQLARRWLDANVPPGSRLVVEPFVPGDFLTARLRGRAPYVRFPVKRPFQGYERRLDPGLIDQYRAGGYCLVVVGSYQKDRGLKEGLANARAYYDRLDRESDLAARFSPYYADADPPGFNFDKSFNYYSPAYARPGPLVEVRRLRGCGGA